MFVHRLVAKGTFEERLAKIMEDKQKLSAMAPMVGESWIADLDNDALRELFSQLLCLAHPKCCE